MFIFTQINNKISFFFHLQGGEVVQETITSNISDDIIILEFQRTDGTLITQLIDFRSVSRMITKKLLIIFPSLLLSDQTLIVQKKKNEKPAKTKEQKNKPETLSILIAVK